MGFIQEKDIRNKEQGTRRKGQETRNKAQLSTWYYFHLFKIHPYGLVKKLCLHNARYLC